MKKWFLEATNLVTNGTRGISFEFTNLIVARPTERVHAIRHGLRACAANAAWVKIDFYGGGP